MLWALCKHRACSESGQDCDCILLQLLSKASVLAVSTNMLVLLKCHGLRGCQED